MTWVRSDDGDCWDPRVVAIVRTRYEHQAVLGMRAMLREHAARHRTDGFLSAYVVADILTRAWLARFTAPPDGGIALLHRRGDDCRCLRGLDWPAGADFAVHGYLDTNPSREETDVARAKAAELRDRELRALVRRRDNDQCRYCMVPVRWSDHRSGNGGVMDHVDPNRAAGAANLVVSCRNCNSRKGKRTPAAAGMLLLPEPTPDPTRNPWNTNGSTTDTTTGAPARGRDGPSAHTPADGLGGWPMAGAEGTRAPTPGVGQRPGPAPPRTSADPNPYLRDPGPDPEHHAGWGEP